MAWSFYRDSFGTQGLSQKCCHQCRLKTSHKTWHGVNCTIIFPPNNECVWLRVWPGLLWGVHMCWLMPCELQVGYMCCKPHNPTSIQDYPAAVRTIPLLSGLPLLSHAAVRTNPCCHISSRFLSWLTDGEGQPSEADFQLSYASKLVRTRRNPADLLPFLDDVKITISHITAWVSLLYNNS